PDGKRIYFVRSSSLASPDLYVASTSGPPGARALTRTLPLNFAAAGLEEPQVVHFKGSDGLQLAGILFRPLGYIEGTRYPAVIWVHGGPEGQSVLNFDPWAQFLAQEGYIVFAPNYRGSAGYGEKFRNLNVLDLGGGEAQDIGAAVRFLVDKGLADSKRIAIGGGSHGGTMVNYAVTKLPDLFCAAISLYGVSNRATFLQRTNRNSVIRMEMKMGGTPDENPATYRQTNILLDVGKIRTPMLIMHGEDDPQVPLYESAQLARALKKERKPFWYFTYAREGHGFQIREHRLDAYRKQFAFLNWYLQPSFGHSTTSLDEAFYLETGTIGTVVPSTGAISIP
ncbi:MAG TPA: S9 family peptidase, partial [Candidatus Acidoferrum sp.]|nr:S9 family peptidase [Candidatus Acidoferrum sp.]